MLLHWHKILAVNTCTSFNIGCYITFKLLRDTTVQKYQKISLAKLGLYFTVHACQPSGHFGQWTCQSCQLAAQADEPVRPFCSDIFQWPGPTLNTQADCAVGMSCNSTDSTPKTITLCVYAWVQKTAIKCGRDKGLGCIASKASAISMVWWSSFWSGGI